MLLPFCTNKNKFQKTKPQENRLKYIHRLYPQIIITI